MEESLKDALLEAGERLAEMFRAGLSRQGLPDEVCLIVDEGRVVVASRSAVVRQAELGEAGTPPRGVMEGLGRDAAPALVEGLSRRLEGLVR